MELSKRLQAVADLLDCHDRIADIGCDHGFVSIYLIESKKARRCLAMDVNKGPLERAKEHVMEKRLSTYIETRLSNGAKAIQFVEKEDGRRELEVDAALIAGMGGRLMIQIIRDSLDKFQSMKEFVLQPQSEIGKVRQFIRIIGCHIEKEDMVLEDGKYYSMMKVTPERREPDWSVNAPGHIRQKIESGEITISDISFLGDEYGEHLLKEKHPVLLQFLEKEKNLYQEILADLEQRNTGKSEVRRKEIEDKLKYINLGLEWFGYEM